MLVLCPGVGPGRAPHPVPGLAPPPINEMIQGGGDLSPSAFLSRKGLAQLICPGRS